VRTIKKRPPPASLVTWQQQRIAAHGADGFELAYEAMRRDDGVMRDVEDILHGEQGAICAYTGRRIQLRAGPPRKVGFHLEHLNPQEHCEEGEDTDYNNLVACCRNRTRRKARPMGPYSKATGPHLPRSIPLSRHYGRIAPQGFRLIGGATFQQLGRSIRQLKKQ
jgi:hypothetical protein